MNVSNGLSQPLPSEKIPDTDNKNYTPVTDPYPQMSQYIPASIPTKQSSYPMDTVITISSSEKQTPDGLNPIEVGPAQFQTRHDNRRQHDSTTLETDYQRGINWDQSNTMTLNEWITECNKQQFIYEDVIEKILKKSNLIKIFILILCAIQSLISVCNLGIGDTQNVYLSWGIKIVLSITSTLTYTLTQYMTLEKYDDNIKSYTSYIENLNNLLSDLTTTSDIKPELRPDGDKFIIDRKDIYMNIYRKCPYIGQTEWKDAIDEYNDYLKHLDTKADNYHGRKRHAYTRYVTDSGDRNQGRSTDVKQQTR
jgi:hypothetical protein